MSSTPTTKDGTVLPFPDRFHAASEFVLNPPSGAASIDDETKLILYALNQQALQGECKEPKPWAWSVVDTAKWNSWKQLKDMPKVEAMRLYVRVLEESVQPDWWLLSRGAALKKDGSKDSTQQSSTKKRSLRDAAIPGSWAVAEVSGTRRPSPRYEHAVSLFRRKLYVIGGNCSGRYLSDVWTLDLDTLAWSQISTTANPPEAVGGGVAEPLNKEEEALLPPAMTPIAGHALTMWGESILCIGGHTKSKGALQQLLVRALDTGTNVWSTLSPSGETPPNRGSHTANMVGNKVYIFGGEDKSRRAVNDLYVLDMDTLEWTKPEFEGPVPPARAAHIACTVEDRFLVVFGGGSVARCFNDLWVLDTSTQTWTQLKPAGPIPSPRAGHAGDVLDGTLYIVGGGNNSSACTDLVALSLAGLGGTPIVDTPALEWASLSKSDLAASTATEGLSLCSLPHLGLLLAFGGYNGKYHNAVQVFRPDFGPESSESQEKDMEETAAEAPASTSSQPAPQSPMLSVATKPPTHKRRSSISEERPSASPKAASEQQSMANGHAAPSLSRAVSLEDRRTASLEARVRDVTASKEAMQSEMQLMRKQLTSALDAKTAVDKELTEAKDQVKVEQKRVFQLEVKLAEANEKLDQVAELEKQLTHYRKMIEEGQGSKGKGGLWGYIAG